MTDTTDPSPIDQGTLDWAHSMQARNAEYLVGKLARQNHGEAIDPAYRDRLMRAAVEGGTDPAVAAAALDRPVGGKMSEFDEPEVRRSSGDLVEDLTTTMRNATMSTGDRQLLVWSLATGQVNALCAANNWDPIYYHIFVDPDLLVFCNGISKLLAECFARENAVVGDQVDMIGLMANAQSEEIQRRAVDLFASAVLRGTPRASEPWSPSPAAYNYAQQLTMALNFFPLAHELAHLHLEHVEAPATRKRPVEDHGDFLVYAQDDEFQADIVGALVTIETLKRLQVPGLMNALAPYIFLKSIALLESCFEVFDVSAGEMSATHPSSIARARKMRGAIEYIIGRGAPVPRYANALRAVDRVLDVLLFGCIMNLRRLKAEGRTPRERIRLTVAEYDERMDAAWKASRGE